MKQSLRSKVAAYLKKQGKELPAAKTEQFKPMNAKAWAASIILIVPIFIIVYLLSQRFSGS